MLPIQQITLARRLLSFSDMRRLAQICLLLTLGTVGGSPAYSAEDFTLTAEVKLVRSDTKQPLKDYSRSVLWLVPAEDRFKPATSADPHARMLQKDKRFEPDLLIIPVGTYVDFPNLDPWFHNVFSLFRGKRFDLGLYQAGAQRSVRFDQAGVSYLFCNIHPEMSAVIVAVDSQWYGASDASGKIRISNIPRGKYVLHVWHENSSPELLASMQRVIEITDNRVLSPITVAVQPQTQGHKNKYGKDYDPDVFKQEY